jgi:periplasmic mercuric ion binding protein
MKRSLILAVALTLATATAQATTIEMKVFGMVCGFCAQGIEKSLRKYPATADVTVSLEHQLVAITTRDGTDIPDADLHKTIEEAGYDLKSVTRTQRSMNEIRGQLAGTK